MLSINKNVFILLLAVFCAGTIFAGGQSEFSNGEWKPNKTIRIIVPWEAGSPVDLVTRITAEELRKNLGVRFSISNQIGVSGATGTENAMNAKKDGYTWVAGMTADLASYKLFDILDTSIKDDWEIFLSLGNPGMIGVSADSPYMSFNQLLSSFKASPGQIGVAMAGEGSAGHVCMDVIRRYTGINYRLDSYDSGLAAITAAASGIVPITSQPASEQAEMIKSGKIRPLAVLWDSDMILDKFGSVPSIKKSIPNLSFGLNYFGIFIPKGVPKEVIATVTRVWNENIANSERLKKYAAERGLIFAPAAGEDAQNKALGWYQWAAWLSFDTGKTKKSPNLVGIPRP